MDIYNRYLMRASGERKFQARTLAEHATFAVCDFLREKGMIDPIFRKLGTESEINRWMEELNERIKLAIKP